MKVKGQEPLGTIIKQYSRQYPYFLVSNTEFSHSVGKVRSSKGNYATNMASPRAD